MRAGGLRPHRDLPWRRTRDPWAVLVSETMLQQTQVARVVPRYGPFLARFPTVGSCAAATPADVVRLWQGLGYNRRALWLHRAAVAVVDHHGGQIPDDLASLMALPGVGPYTARAVLVFAFEHDEAVLDTNVARIVARLSGRPLTRIEAQEAAQALVPVGRAWDWNQGMIDLGALVCTVRDPRCSACPLVGRCEWRARGAADPDPARRTAGVSGRQPEFEGSSRQGRGRLVAALCQGPVRTADLASVMGWPQDPGRAGAVAAGVVADGLAVERDGVYELAGSHGGPEACEAPRSP